MNNVLLNITNALGRASGLNYIKSLTTSDDVNACVERGKFPFINVEGDNISIEDLPDFDGDSERETYKIIIQFATKNAVKSICVLGGTDFKGIWQVSRDIYNALKDYCESVKNVSDGLVIVVKPKVNQRTWVMSDAQYMAGAEMQIEFYSDRFYP